MSILIFLYYPIFLCKYRHIFLYTKIFRKIFAETGKIAYLCKVKEGISYIINKITL